MKRFVLILGVLASMTTPGFAALIYDVAADFSASQNPSGPWSYGYVTTLTGPFTIYTATGSSGGVDYWNNPATLEGVGRNDTAGPAGWCGSCEVPAGHIIMSPGFTGNASVVRFTAPSTSVYDLEASFYGADHVGTTTDVHILLDGNSLLSDLIVGYGTTSSYSGFESLTVGDTVDFIVGWGNGSYDYDATGLNATLTPVAAPEPGTLLPLGAGLLALVARRRRK